MKKEETREYVQKQKNTQKAKRLLGERESSNHTIRLEKMCKGEILVSAGVFLLLLES